MAALNRRDPFAGLPLRWQRTADEAGEALRIMTEQTPARSGIRLTHAPVWG